ncbi:hypothetical protein EDM02_04715 [Candidatus Cardinium hertigii]|uniref:Uncharacterized protein n=1 Tax=Candidatus Cardinium hertigii TaxID=247481 RepID=A0A3N2QC41_9BACT|nr:hypothetical protein EDM02_04715 [Candidatus Cardinium hertigii]
MLYFPLRTTGIDPVKIVIIKYKSINITVLYRAIAYNLVVLIIKLNTKNSKKQAKINTFIALSSLHLFHTIFLAQR